MTSKLHSGWEVHCVECDANLHPRNRESELEAVEYWNVRTAQEFNDRNRHLAGIPEED